MSHQPEPTMTIEQVRAAIGHERPAWVTVLPAYQLAILVRACRGEGDAVLIRYASDGDSDYAWVSAGQLIRREGLDKGPEPTWLQRARVSTRPPAVLWDILRPAYSARALGADVTRPVNPLQADPDQALDDELNIDAQLDRQSLRDAR